MSKGRLEAFSDGVIAIIITIMVLELKPPTASAEISALAPLLRSFLAYVLSFLYVGIYWNNHHHLLQATSRVSGGVLWANQHLLFWLSLVPFTTAWLGACGFQSGPVALYGMVLLMAAVAYTILQYQIIKADGPDSKLAQAIGNDRKGRFSLASYVLGMACAFVAPAVSCLLFSVVAIVWLIPDRRIERHLG